MYHIAKTVKNATKLELSGNAIGNSGLKYLCEALSTNTSLTDLVLFNCSIDDHTTISQLLRTNTTLQHLNLTHNTINNTQFNNLCEALSTNILLKWLDLSYCSLTILNDSGAALYQLLSENNSLQYLSLSGNAVTIAVTTLLPG